MSMHAVGNIPQGTILYQGRYRIDLLLAHTPHRAIYRAWNFARNRAATIVELAASDEQHVTTALERAAPLVQLDHHTLTSFQVVFVEEDTVFIGLTFAGGQTIEHIMADRAVPIVPSAAVRWISQAAEMLEFFDTTLPGWHLGDLSKGALFVTSEDRVQLLGFEIPLGLLTPAEIAAELPRGAVAPEMQQGVCDARSDVYGLAATLHLLLTGQAWVGSDPAYHTALDNVQPELPRPLVTTLRRALKVNPDERWSDVPAFHGALLAAMATREVAMQPQEWWQTTDTLQPLNDEPTTLITQHADLANAMADEAATRGEELPVLAAVASNVPAEAKPDDTFVPTASTTALIIPPADSITQEIPIITEATTWEDLAASGNGTYAAPAPWYMAAAEPLPPRDALGTSPTADVNAAVRAIAPALLDNLAETIPASEPSITLDDVQPMLDISWLTFVPPPENAAATNAEANAEAIASPSPVEVAPWAASAPLIATSAMREAAPAYAPLVDNNGPLVSFIALPVVQSVPPPIPVAADVPAIPAPPAPEISIESAPAPELVVPPVAEVPLIAPLAEQLLVMHVASPVAEPPRLPVPALIVSKTPSRPLLDRLRSILPAQNTPAVATGTIVVPRHMYSQHSYTILVRLQCRVTRKPSDQPSDAPALALIEVEASSDAFYLPVKKMALPIPLNGGLSEASLSVTAQRVSPTGTDRMTFSFRLADGTSLHKGRHFVAEIAILTPQQIANGNLMLTLVHPLDIAL